MKKTLFVVFTVAGLAFGLFSTALAESGKKEITLNGSGCCAKCCLKEGDSCQNVVQVEKDGKKTTFYLVDNAVSKDFHSNICKKVQPIKVTGTCKKVGDKLEVTASKIELAK